MINLATIESLCDGITMPCASENVAEHYFQVTANCEVLRKDDGNLIDKQLYLCLIEDAKTLPQASSYGNFNMSSFLD